VRKENNKLLFSGVQIKELGHSSEYEAVEVSEPVAKNFFKTNLQYILQERCS
jgi:hypothetical protein